MGGCILDGLSDFAKMADLVRFAKKLKGYTEQ